MSTERTTVESLKNENYTLKSILELVKKEKLIIPNFQRNFVWKTKDILNLGDSIIREYPISSVLLMKGGGSLQIPGKILGTNKILKTKEELNTLKNTENYYILDGQQRLTSLSEIFLGINDKYEYYFDLLSILVDLFPEDNILDFEFITNKNGEAKKISELIEGGQFRKIDEILCTSYKKNKSGEMISRGYGRYISTKAVYNNQFIFQLTSFLENFKNLPVDTKQKYLNKLNEVLSKVSLYQLPVTKISEDADLNLVIRIFEKINTSGMRLSLFDLVNAKSFSIDSDGLGRFLTNEIKNYCAEKNIKIDAFNKVFKYSEIDEIYLDLSRIIRILEMLFLLENGELITNFANSRILSRDPRDWYSQWNKYKEKILEFYSYFYEKGILDHLSPSGLEYFCTIYSYYPIKEKEFFFKNILKVLLAANLKEETLNKQHVNLYKQIINFAKHLSEAGFGIDKYNIESLSFIKQYCSTLMLDLDFILDIKYSPSNNKFRAIMYLIYGENLGNYGVRDLEGNLVKDLKNTDFHHIIPIAQAKFYSKEVQKLINSVANIVVLNSNSNRFVIKDKLFSEYILTLKNNLGEENFNKILENNLIDPILVDEFLKEQTEENLKAILIDRGKKIFSLINEYFKN